MINIREEISMRAIYSTLYKNVLLISGEHFTEEYKKINPFGLVPVIDDNGFLLTERFKNYLMYFLLWLRCHMGQKAELPSADTLN